MDISHSTARGLAPLSFVVDFAAQNYGMLSSPNMKDVQDANLSFFSPQLCRANAGSNTNDPIDQADISTMVDFPPCYALGNFHIAIWMFFWNSSNLKTSNIFIIISSLAQLYYAWGARPAHNGSVAYFNHQNPGTMAKDLTAVIFGALALSSDWVLGSCLVYDLVALAAGQRRYGNWENFTKPPYLRSSSAGYQSLP
ncbi:hypothetical protein B0T25DRAFT_591875 [Lasiosphaeria hispida]|uniref:Uncharacterized protein n=1 Tax=Lasiosphaeria hispida TaxID=260671 RepID=A0AAJ0MCH4_9PEZI|nr:hypothetical protein B0T25DRAFT_591875 [Lasiosphaeria hispida]